VSRRLEVDTRVEPLLRVIAEAPAGDRRVVPTTAIEVGTDLREVLACFLVSKVAVRVRPLRST
jgi:hypothetical protein